MWIKKFTDLNDLRLFLIKQIEYNEMYGFSFFQIMSGMNFTQITNIHGKPDIYNLESEQQQILQYNSVVIHPLHGTRDHFKLNTVFWAFNEESLEIIRVHFDYFKTKELADPFYQFIKELFDDIVEKFGTPQKKVNNKFNPEISYIKGKHKFFMWSNSEGLRIQIK